MEFYVFDDEQTAIDAEANIKTIGQLPRTGVNSLTGEEAPDKQKTTRWAVPWSRITDGKWVFQRLPLEIRNQYPQEAHDAFNVAFPHVIEEYEDAWVLITSEEAP